MDGCEDGLAISLKFEIFLRRTREDRFGRLVGRGAVIKPRCYMASSGAKDSCGNGTCHPFPVPSVHQTLDEMDFDRGLWNAALFGDEMRIKHMLDKGVSANMEDASGYTALHYAARNGHLNICQALIRAGADVNTTTRSGRATALHRAAMCGHVDIVELLLKYGADPLLKDTDGRLALHRAAQAGHACAASVLLNAAPQSATVPDLYGKSPACYAPGNKDLIKIFGQRT